MSEYSCTLGVSETKQQIKLNLKMANRHGLIAGATGTGKTVTLQVLAEQFSKQGVPVFTADVKGDLSGLAAPGKEHPKITERIKKIGIEDFSFKKLPVTFWDLYGENGHPIRTTLTDVGPLLLARLFELNDTQTGVLESVFRIGRDKDLPIIDLKDLKSVLNYAADNNKEFMSEYGNMSKASIGAIMRDVMSLEDSGASHFFGEPALKVEHIIRCSESGKGVINILDATKLVNDPRLYSTFLLWLLTELFEILPEVGDPEKPKLVFFFDEAHMLFDGAPKALLEKVELVVRLIRSKGVGIFFVTQNPTDIPASVAGQLGNRVQHALRAFSEKDRKAIRETSKTFRDNEAFSTEEWITKLGVGESLISVLDEKGMPTIVEKVLNSPPETQMGPITPEARQEIIKNSLLGGFYSERIDRDSAYERLKERAVEKEKNEPEESKELKIKSKGKGYKRQTKSEAFFKSIVRSAGSRVGRQLVNSVMKSFFKR